MSDRERDGFWWLDQIDDYVRSHAYDCTCQAGGVDAMSIDTDWLRHAVQTIRDEHQAMAERSQRRQLNKYSQLFIVEEGVRIPKRFKQPMNER